jgi:hypothetical protein
MYEIHTPHFVASSTSWRHIYTHPIQNLWSSTKIKTVWSYTSTPFIIIHTATASRNQWLQCVPWLSVTACGVLCFTSKCSGRPWTATLYQYLAPLHVKLFKHLFKYFLVGYTRSHSVTTCIAYKTVQPPRIHDVIRYKYICIFHDALNTYSGYMKSNRRSNPVFASCD